VEGAERGHRVLPRQRVGERGQPPRRRRLLGSLVADRERGRLHRAEGAGGERHRADRRSLAAAGEDLLVLPVADGAVLQLCDQPDGGTVRALLTVEEPVLVPVPGEVARLLGEEAASQVATPLWWLEVRAAAEPEGAVVLARRFAEALRQRLGGVVWPLAP
jgi:hypothetical protein